MSARAVDATNPEGENLHLTGALLDSVECGVMVLGRDRRVLSMNPAAERISGLAASSATARGLDGFPTALRDVIERALLSGQSLQDRQTSLGTDGVGPPDIEVGATPCRDATGNTVAIVVTLRDLAASRRLEDCVRRVDRLADIGVLAADVAHEVKNALVTVKTFAELLPRQNADSEATALVRREVQRIDSLISQLLRLAGPARHAHSSIGLHPVIENALWLVRRQMDARQIQLQKSLAAPAHHVRGVEMQLSQAFLNLFLNAVESMESGGTLTVTTAVLDADSPGAGRLQVVVGDTGCGIAEEHLPRLFTPFFTTKAEGTGLGLAITRRVLQEHGGAIAVETERNKGTRFRIDIPLLPGQG
jgi:signal transduction histidine kinase